MANETKNNTIYWVIGIVAILGLAGGGYYFYNKKQKAGATTNPVLTGETKPDLVDEEPRKPPTGFTPRQKPPVSINEDIAVATTTANVPSNFVGNNKNDIISKP